MPSNQDTNETNSNNELNRHNMQYNNDSMPNNSNINSDNEHSRGSENQEETETQVNNVLNVLDAANKDLYRLQNSLMNNEIEIIYETRYNEARVNYKDESLELFSSVCNKEYKYMKVEDLHKIIELQKDESLYTAHYFIKSRIKEYTKSIHKDLINNKKVAIITDSSIFYNNQFTNDILKDFAQTKSI